MRGLHWSDRREQGQSVIVVTLMIVVILGLMGLTIDGGRLYVTRQQLQTYTDAATMAGTRKLPYGTETATLMKEKVDSATRRALETYARNVGVDIATLPQPPYNYTPAWSPTGQNLKLSYDMHHQSGGSDVVDHVVVTVLYHDALTEQLKYPKERCMLVEASRDVPMIFGSLLGPSVARASRPAAGFKSVFEVKWKFNTQADEHATPLYYVDSQDSKAKVLTASKSGYIFSVDAIGEDSTGRTWAYWKFKVLQNGLGERTLCWPYTPGKYDCEPAEGGDQERPYAIISSPRVTRRMAPATQCSVGNTLKVYANRAVNNGDGTTTLSYKVCNNSTTTALSWVAFAVPAGQTPSWPTNGSTYTRFKSYTVTNVATSPFRSIKFTASGTGIKNECDVFRFTLPTSAAQYALQVQGQYGTSTDGGTFTSDCSFRDPVDTGQDLVLFASYPKSDDTAAGRGYLYALDAHTGDRVWASYVGQRQYQTGAFGYMYIDAAPSFSPDGTIVYYASRDGHIYAFKVTDGSAVWPDCETSNSYVNSCYKMTGGTNSTPVINPLDGTIYVATSKSTGGSGTASPSDRGVIHALWPEGVVRWTWQPPRTGEGFDSSPRLWPANNPTTLYIGGRDQRLYSINIASATPSVRWEYYPPSTITPPGQASGNPRDVISCTPLIVQENGSLYVYFATQSGAAFKLLDSGSSVSKVWNTWLGYDVNTASSPPGGDGYPRERRAIHISADIAQDFVYYGVSTYWDTQSAFQALRKDDGTIFQSFVMENDTHSTLRVAANNWLYYASCDNHCYGVDTNPDALDSRLIR